MTDISHSWGSDLDVEPSGDLKVASPSTAVQQRILRRLLTTQREYIWNPDYGAGLGNFVGQPADTRRIRALVVAQVLQEAAVAKDPAPAVFVRGGSVGEVQALYADIHYRDAISGSDQRITIPVSS